MSRRLTPEDWRTQVWKSPEIADSVRVVLLFLAEHMRADRHVSVPREKIARTLGRSERRISQRIADAHTAGFLDTVASGHRGRTAVYVGTFPDSARSAARSERVTGTSTLSGSESVTLSTGERVTPGGPTITRADLSVSGHSRNGGSNEETEDRPASSRLRVVS